MAKQSLFVVDIQSELALDPKTAIPHASRVCGATEVILARARETVNPQPYIVFVQHSERAEEPGASLIAGSKAWEIVFAPRENCETETLVQKMTGDTFESNPSLAADLRAREIEEIVILGIQSECCVRATCLGARQAGFQVTLLQGAHSTYNDQASSRTAEEIEKDVETEMGAAGVKILPWETFEF